MSYLARLIALSFLLFAQGVFAAGADGPDVRIECPCSFTSTSSEEATATIGVVNIGSSSVTPKLQAWMHSTWSIIEDPDPAFLGEVTLDAVAASSTLSPKAFTMPLDPDKTGTFYVTFELSFGGEESDYIRMEEQITVGSNFSVTGIDFLKDTDGDGVGDFNEKLEGTDPNNAGSKPGASVVDIMVLYDSSLPTEYNNDHLARINHVVTVTNTALKDSKIDMQFRLVESRQVEPATFDYEKMLTEAEEAQGNYKDVKTWRTQFGADIVVLVTAKDSTGSPSCGVATAGSFGQEGMMAASVHMSVNDIRFDGCDDMTVLHEIGHNIGLSHSAAQGTTGAFNWSRGYGVKDKFHTVMAYPDGFNNPPLSQVLSNPNVTCAGVACGVAETDTQPANAARSVEIVRFQVARYVPTAVTSSSDSNTSDSSNSNDSTDTENTTTTTPNSSDTDEDGIPNLFETVLGSDPAVADATGDADNDGLTNQAEFDALPRARQFLQTNSISQNITTLHVVNTSDAAQPFTATLYNGDGEVQGKANQNLSDSNVAANARLKVSSAQLETIFGVSAWSGPAVLEVVGAGSFELMAKLKSPSGLISNTNCVRQGSVHNLEGSDSADRTFIRFINVGSTAITNITGTLYDANGATIGTANKVLLASLAANASTWLSREQIADLFGNTWNGEATLKIASPHENLRLLNLNRVSAGTFFNFSCYQVAK